MEPRNWANLPEELQDRLRPVAHENRQDGRLGNTLLRVHDEETGPAYLKIADGSAAEDLRREASRLRWIGERLPVPKVLSFVAGDTSFLLLSELAGTPAHTWKGRLNEENLMEVLAAALVTIHALPIDDCPFDGLLESELAEAEQRLADGAVVRVDFIRTYDEEPETSLEWLRANTSLVRDRVFTHGDFCLPNVLIKEGVVTGIVDWGLAGIADRHRDWMSVDVTLRLNGSSQHLRAFHEAYGPPDVAATGVSFYATLDRFF